MSSIATTRPAATTTVARTTEVASESESVSSPTGSASQSQSRSSSAPPTTASVTVSRSVSQTSSQPDTSSVSSTGTTSSVSSRFTTVTRSSSSTPISSSAASSTPLSSSTVVASSSTGPVVISTVTTSTLFVTTTAPRTSTTPLPISGTGKYTFTSVFASTDSSGATHTITQVIARQTNGSGTGGSKGFLSNGGAVAGVSVVAGVIGAGIIALILLACLKKRKNRRLDRDAWDAAQMSYAHQNHAAATDADEHTGPRSTDSHGTLNEPPMVAMAPLSQQQSYPAPVVPILSATGHILDDEFNEPGRAAQGGAGYPAYNAGNYAMSETGPGMAGFGAGGNRPRNAGNAYPSTAYNGYQNNTPGQGRALPAQQTSSHGHSSASHGYAGDLNRGPSTGANSRGYAGPGTATSPTSTSYLGEDPFAGTPSQQYYTTTNTSNQPSRAPSKSSKNRPTSTAASAPSIYSNDHDDDDDEFYGGYVPDGQADARLDPNAVQARRSAFANAGPTGSNGSGLSLRDDTDYSRKILR